MQISSIRLHDLPVFCLNCRKIDPVDWRLKKVHPSNVWKCVLLVHILYDAYFVRMIIDIRPYFSRRSLHDLRRIQNVELNIFRCGFTNPVWCKYRIIDLWHWLDDLNSLMKIVKSKASLGNRFYICVPSVFAITNLDFGAKSAPLNIQTVEVIASPASWKMCCKMTRNTLLI